MVANKELKHFGIKGMKWGRRRYQNKDGSLTEAGRKRYGDSNSEPKKETEEEYRSRRAKTLKSTDAKELYKNRDTLSTAEINERLNRIDAEQRLAKVASGTQKTGMDRVNTVLKWGQKANDVYNFINSPAVKALRRKITGEPKRSNNPLDLKKIWDNRGTFTDQEMSAFLKRANTEAAFKKLLDQYESAKRKVKETDRPEKVEIVDSPIYNGQRKVSNLLLEDPDRKRRS